MAASASDKTIRSIILLYAAGDIEGLKLVWHPDIEVYAFDGRSVRGADRVAATMQAFLEQGYSFEIDPDYRSNGPNVLIDGQVVSGDKATAVSWLWTFSEDGRLRRSLAFTRSEG